MSEKRRIGAFTLLEVMVAVVVLAIVASMATAGYAGYRERANLMESDVNASVIAAATKLSAYDNNSLPGSLSELKSEYLERAYVQWNGRAKPYTLLAYFHEWIGESTAEAYTLDHDKYLASNPLKTLTCPSDPTKPQRLSNGKIENPSYTIDPAAAGQPLSWLLDPNNANLSLIYESDVPGGTKVYHHMNNTVGVESAVGGQTDWVDAKGKSHKNKNKHGG